MSSLLPVLITSSILVCSHAASCAPCIILPACDEIAISSEISPIVCEVCILRPRASALGCHPSSSMAAHTRSRVSCGIVVFGASLTTKETVVCETPAARATSYIEGGLRFDDLGGVATASASAFDTAALGD